MFKIHYNFNIVLYTKMYKLKKKHVTFIPTKNLQKNLPTEIQLYATNQVV